MEPVYRFMRFADSACYRSEKMCWAVLFFSTLAFVFVVSFGVLALGRIDSLLLWSIVVVLAVVGLVTSLYLWAVAFVALRGK